MLFGPKKDFDLLTYWVALINLKLAQKPLSGEKIFIELPNLPDNDTLIHIKYLAKQAGWNQVLTSESMDPGIPAVIQFSK